MTTPAVTAVIVTYRSRETVGAALDALHEAHLAGLAEAVVVDNASDDDTADFVEERYPWVTLIRSADNLGFGRGCNVGLRNARTPFVLLLNPDAVLPVNGLQRMITFMQQHPRAGICGPAVREHAGDVQPAGCLPTPGRTALKPLFPGWASKGLWHVQPGEAPRSTDRICGSIMLIRRQMLDSVGEFDPRFFLYFEETDLCFRTIRTGWQIWTVGDAIGEHINAASGKAMKVPMMWGTISEHYFKSRFYYFKKHYGWLSAAAAETGELCCMFVRYVLNRFRGKAYPNLGQRLRSPFYRMPTDPTL